MSLACVRGIHRWPVDSPHKGPVMQEMFPFDDIIMRQNDQLFDQQFADIIFKFIFLEYSSFFYLNLMPYSCTWNEFMTI